MSRSNPRARGRTRCRGPLERRRRRPRVAAWGGGEAHRGPGDGGEAAAALPGWRGRPGRGHRRRGGPQRPWGHRLRSGRRSGTAWPAEAQIMGLGAAGAPSASARPGPSASARRATGLGAGAQWVGLRPSAAAPRRPAAQRASAALNDRLRSRLWGELRSGLGGGHFFGGRLFRGTFFAASWRLFWRERAWRRPSWSTSLTAFFATLLATFLPFRGPSSSVLPSQRHFFVFFSFFVLLRLLRLLRHDRSPDRCG